jgi:hypothetical protein
MQSDRRRFIDNNAPVWSTTTQSRLTSKLLYFQAQYSGVNRLATIFSVVILNLNRNLTIDKYVQNPSALL